MTIPIRNLYYLFCYAWARFPEGGATDVGIDACPDLPNLFAKILINGVNRLMRRGLDRGYVEIQEETRSPRGRLQLDRSVKEQTLLRGTIVCQFDELQHDVIHNQILKVTAIVLSREETISLPLAHDLRLIARRLSGVSDIRFSAEAFRRVQLFRNNGQYAMLMRLCEFVYRSILPSSDGRGSRFNDILKDEEKMSRVFEDFLRNFYYYEQSVYSVSSEEMRWSARELVDNDLSLIPIMKTDLTLRSPTKIIVMDAKFHAEPFPRSYGTPKLRAGHLYQIYAYMKNASRRSPGVRVHGALVYASTGEAISKHFLIDGQAVTVVAVDLSRPWPEIHRELLDLVSNITARNCDSAPTLAHA